MEIVSKFPGGGGVRLSPLENPVTPELLDASAQAYNDSDFTQPWAEGQNESEGSV